MFHWKSILNVLGLLTAISGFAILLALPFSFYYDYPLSPDEFPIHHGTPMAILYSGLISMLLGAGVWGLTYKHIREQEVRKRDGYVIVTLGWLVMSLVGAIPYVASGAIPSFTDAFFETMSGFTTTGATILADQIEALPMGLHFWRAMTHWIGGMGIIVLTIAVLPLLGIGGMQLFAAEVPGPTPDKLTPRVKETAKRLWLVYFGLTILETVLLMLDEMSFFDALCHSMATLSTGGFSTQQASMGAFGAYSQYVVIIFMFLAGVNFSLTYFALKGKTLQLWKNEEFRVYLFAVLILTSIVTSVVFLRGEISFENSFRNAAFQVVSIMTTTGFGTADFTAWGPFLLILFFVLMFTGACAGSTSGGIKMVRSIVVLKNSYLELKRQIHPKAILPVRFNGKGVQPEIVSKMTVFFVIFITIYVLGCFVMSTMIDDFDTILGSVAATLGNIGPGLGAVGPGDTQNFAVIPDAGKWFLSFLMLLGRLELFTVLMLFSPFFWKEK